MRAAKLAAACLAGLAPYAPEWWHFTLASEPYPDRHFDAPVR
jgi:D-alanyl-D-alanine dipeptidase